MHDGGYGYTLVLGEQRWVGNPNGGLQSAVKGLKAKEMLDERMPMPLACNLCYSKDI